MKWLIRRFQRFLLKQRIELLRADIAVVGERREQSLVNAEAAQAWLDGAHQKLRSMRANLACIERPQVLLDQALSDRGIE